MSQRNSFQEKMQSTSADTKSLEEKLAAKANELHALNDQLRLLHIEKEIADLFRGREKPTMGPITAAIEKIKQDIKTIQDALSEHRIAAATKNEHVEKIISLTREIKFLQEAQKKMLALQQQGPSPVDAKWEEKHAHIKTVFDEHDAKSTEEDPEPLTVEKEILADELLKETLGADYPPMALTESIKTGGRAGYMYNGLLNALLDYKRQQEDKVAQLNTLAVDHQLSLIDNRLQTLATQLDVVLRLPETIANTLQTIKQTMKETTEYLAEFVCTRENKDAPWEKRSKPWFTDSKKWEIAVNLYDKLSTYSQQIDAETDDLSEKTFVAIARFKIQCKEALVDFVSIANLQDKGKLNVIFQKLLEKLLHIDQQLTQFASERAHYEEFYKAPAVRASTSMHTTFGQPPSKENPEGEKMDATPPSPLSQIKKTSG